MNVEELPLLGKQYLPKLVHIDIEPSLKNDENTIIGEKFSLLIEKSIGDNFKFN